MNIFANNTANSTNSTTSGTSTNTPSVVTIEIPPGILTSTDEPDTESSTINIDIGDQTPTNTGDVTFTIDGNDVNYNLPDKKKERD